MGGSRAVLAGGGGLGACVAVDDGHSRKSTGETEEMQSFGGGGAPSGGGEGRTGIQRREVKSYWCEALTWAVERACFDVSVCVCVCVDVFVYVCAGQGGEGERERVRVWRGGCLCASESRKAGEGQLEEWIPLKLMGERRGSGGVGERGGEGRDQYLSNVERGRG